MEKRLRSSIQTSADEFISSATKLPFKSSKTAIKNLINILITPSSDLTSTLPLSLRNSISHSISQFKNRSDSAFTESPVTPPAKRVHRSGRNTKNGVVSPSKSRRQSVVEKLKVYAYVLRLCILHPKGVFSDSDLLPAVQELHDSLTLFECDLVLLSEIANLCEEWWKRGLLGKETLISRSLPVILSRSLTSKKKVDVHSVYTLRDAFALFEFEDESIEDLKNLLIRCVISPLYLKTEDGRKFIACMCSFSLQLAKEVFAMIKSQIPFGRKSMLEAYGEIIFRAWKGVEEEFKDEIENRFLQGLFEGAIYASSGELAASIRRVLGGFVSNRTTEGVEKIIFRLSEPVIFRSLQVANSMVRQNALLLLLDLFPLEDPGATKVVTERLLEKQFFLLEKLLMDECPDVRVVAVEGCCRTLNLFWEVIPSSIITKVITRIFDDMTHDACTDVRLSTVNGVIYMIGNPLSHEVLKVLLPRLGNLIMDSALVVRAAITDLLLVLNDIRNFHFHKVVRLEELFSVLANDQSLIARKITKLLIPSYFPSKLTEEEACKRCITLIKRSPLAGARFCQFALSEGASLRSLMKLCKVIIDLTLSSVKLDKEQIEGLLLAASHLCSDIANDASLMTALKEYFSGENLKALFAVASSASAQSSVCNIISIISLDSVGDLFEDCMGLLIKCSDLSDNIGRQGEVRSAHKMIGSCGWFDDMFEVLVEFLEKAAYGCHVKFGIELEKLDIKSAKRRKTKSSNKVKSKDGNVRKPSNIEKNRLSEDYDIAAGVAWQIKDLLLCDISRKAILSSVNLKRAYFALKVVSEATILHSLQYDYFSVSHVSAYTTLALHMSLHNIMIDGCDISTQVTISNLTIDHLLHCIKLLSANDSKRSDSSGKSQTGDHIQTLILSTVKTLTAILKFIIDAAAMDLVPQSQETTVILSTEILKFIITKLREQSISSLKFTEEALKDIYHCLKSSFTYAAKLLNTVLKTLPQAGPYSLLNELFNLIVSIEEFLGYRYAARFISIVQPWVPDLILALGSQHLLNQSPENKLCDNPSKNATSSWFYILARSELRELLDHDSDEDTDFKAFKRLLETMSQLLNANYDVLDAVGMIFLAGAVRELENKNFDAFLGLLHFVCVKLVGTESRERKELKLMAASLEEMYSNVAKEAENPSNSEEDIQKLCTAKALLEPVCMSFINKERRNSMEEEE